jgi:hypothetical protein
MFIIYKIAKLNFFKNIEIYTKKCIISLIVFYFFFWYFKKIVI